MDTLPWPDVCLVTVGRVVSYNSSSKLRRIMTEVDPRNIAPSQDFLKEKTVSFILQCMRDGQEDQLPPMPIVRRDNDGEFVAIDGHNLLAAKAFHGRLQEVHIAKSAEDGLPSNSEATLLRNQDLKDKFESCLIERDAVKAQGVSSFDDLITKYHELFEEAK